jgi:RNA polymerase sigma-70 factor (ECF subfamily)
MRPYWVTLTARISKPRTPLRLVEPPREEGHLPEQSQTMASRPARALESEAVHLAGAVDGDAPVGGDAAVDGNGTWTVAPEPLSSGSREDGELVALALAGQAGAFEALYRRHSPYALALAVRVQGSATDIEDIVHDAFLRVHDGLQLLRSGASFRPWLASIVVSLVRTRMRRRRMLAALGLVTKEPIDLDSLVTREAGPEVRAQLAQVYLLLREQPVDHRICWTLRYIEGRKLEDVAVIADCSLATAKRRIAAVQEQILLLESSANRLLSVGEIL